MVWLGMILAMIWAQSLQGWSEWGFRITVLSSLGANLVVGLLSGTRRRSAHGLLWRWLGQAAKFCLWLACQVAEAAPTSAIGSLSLCGSDASSSEKQVVAFWATFLLLHLGGPDNLIAYTLEDNKISSRKWVEMLYRILGAGYAIYNNTRPGSGGWALLPAASVVMLVAGAVRYIETVVALGKANLDSMQEDAASSTSSKEGDDVHNKKMESLKCRIRSTKRQQGRWLRDGAALLLAQDLFPIWRHALVDSSVNPKSERHKASREMILPGWHWESLCKVAEMELSLIYEFLYTKAILAHTWCYYLIRFLSPLFTAAAAFLFHLWLHLHPQQQLRGSYVRITYALLAITFLTDVAWLLRALGSTWAYAYLQQQAPAWLRHQALHGSGRWWCSIHRIVVRLDLLRLLCCRDPVSHRRWSGTIGQYNLLHECTVTTTRTDCCSSQQCPEWWPWSEAGDERPKEMRYLSEKLPRSVKKLLFERVMEILQQAIEEDDQQGDGQKEENKKKMLQQQAIKKGCDQMEEEENKKMYTRVDIRTLWGRRALSRAVGEGKMKWPPSGNKDSIFGQEFEEDVLMWHIATCMVLPHIPPHGDYTQAIEVMSEYMMFLVAARRQMLPGLVLHSQLQLTRETLVKIWRDRRQHLPTVEGLNVKNKEKLATILRLLTTKKDDPTMTTGPNIEGTEGTRLLALAVDLYFYLSGEDRGHVQEQVERRVPVSVPPSVPKVIFNVWVDKLVYAAVRCSRDAHAKQLSAGGDLTTVLWMLIQHAGPFCMGEAPDIRFAYEKQTPKEEKKKDGSKVPPAAPPPPEKKEKPAPPPPSPTMPAFPPSTPSPSPTMPGFPPSLPFPPPTMPGFPPALPLPPPPPSCPMCPPCYHPTYPPVCRPYYDPSWPPVCPWYPQCPPQHDEPEEAREDEDEDSSSDEDYKE